MRLMESHDISLVFLGGGAFWEPDDNNLSKLNVKTTISLSNFGGACMGLKVHGMQLPVSSLGLLWEFTCH